MQIRLVFLLLLCILCLPVKAIASPVQTEDEAAVREAVKLLCSEDSEQQSEALQQMLSFRDDRLVGFLDAFNQGSVYLWKGQPVICSEFFHDENHISKGKLKDPLTKDSMEVDGATATIAESELTEVYPSRKLRRTLRNVVRQLELWSSNVDKRIAAIKRLGDTKDPEFLPMLQEVESKEENSRIKRKARESVLLILAAGKIKDQPVTERSQSIEELGEMASARAVPMLKDILRKDADSNFHPTALLALEKIEKYQSRIRWVQNVFNGLSAGSILILMALGLSIIFGQMGVINMAHGELMMVGAYTAYEMQLLFEHTPDSPASIYFLVALPISFLAAALVGMVIEKVVVRHLYGRPLESLLATWGVGLILIQAARVKYGDNIGVNAPSWLVGSFEPLQDLVIPYNRSFILGLCLFCVFAVYFLLNHTRFGLLIRATVQGRDTASSLGVNTSKVDNLTFALGSGLAGIAGCAWTQIGGVTPDMGQNHIVDSFLVVVTGGVGNLWGAVVAGLGMGIINKLLEPSTFGGGILLLGVVFCLTGWVVITIQAFKQNEKLKWLCLLFPFPLPLVFGFQRMNVPAIFSATITYCIGAIALPIGLWSQAARIPTLDQPIQAIWAKVLILVCVVAFIQWKPMGLFPPRGRLADA